MNSDELPLINADGNGSYVHGNHDQEKGLRAKKNTTLVVRVRKPSAQRCFHLAIVQAQAPPPETELGCNDDVQISWFGQN